jgi:hypothetical protein
VGTAFLVLAAISWWRHHPTSLKVFVGLGGALWLAGLLVPGRLGPVYRAWMGFAHLLSKITTPIFMGAVYFLVITPIGLLMRALGRRPLVHSEKNGGFWVAPASGGRSDMTHQF